MNSDKQQLIYLLDKEQCCPLNKEELYELQSLLDKYGYPETKYYYTDEELIDEYK